MIDLTAPQIRITPHDEIRLNIVQPLTALMSQCLMLPIVHPGQLKDMIDTSMELARVLDSIQYESVELVAWSKKHGQHARVMGRMADAVRNGDIDRLGVLSKQAMDSHPLPVCVVDATVERVQKSA